MDPERYARIKELFGRALDLPAAERGRFVAERAADPAMRDHLAALLAAHEESAGFLATADLEPSTLAVPASPASDTEIGSRIGPYRLIAAIGRGGMGEVFLAERDDGAFARRVALKRIKRGFDSDEVVRRFVHERQILAGLSHPNIARLYDGGTTDDGRPYFAMEAIDGLPITTFAAERGLDLAERLRLVIQVCRAVEHAHKNLIVHRDLKPANILVTTDGTPKLLDFGIAKLLAPAPAGGETRHGGGPLTPDYASPEQLDGGPITTATDVYALGVLLFELLVGANPHTLHPSAGPAARRGPAPTASRALRQVAARDGIPVRRGARLVGDLDTIVAKALEVEPERRYASVADLADDLERYLERRPVRARRSTLAYRFGRLLRRHAVAALVAAVVVLALVVALAQAVAARAERASARDAALRARRLTDYLSGLFAVAAPGQSRGRTVTASDLLDQSARVLGSVDAASSVELPTWLPQKLIALRAEPEARADLLLAIGVVYRERGELEAARASLERALALRPAHGPGADLSRAATLAEIGSTLRELGDTDGAERRLSEALAIRRARLGAGAPEVAECRDALGLVHLSAGDAAAAAAELEQAIAARRRLGEPLALAESLSHAAAVEIDRGHPARAERLFAEAKALRESRLGRDHPLIAEDLAFLGRLFYERGKLAEADRLLARALALRRRVLPRLHPEIAVNLSDLGAVKLGLGDATAATALLAEAVALEEQTYGADQNHPYLADTLLNLGAAQQATARWADAEATFLRALEVERRLATPRPSHRATLLGRLAVVRRDLGDLARAEAYARAALAAWQRVEPDDPLARATAEASLGNLLVARGGAAEGEPHLRRALALRSERLAADDDRIALAQGALGACLTELGRLDEARPLLERSLAALRASLGADHPDVRRAEGRLARFRERALTARPAPAP